MNSVAETLSEEGIETFSKVASVGAFESRIRKGSIVLVAECDDQLVGVVELKAGRHISMLFVAPDRQRDGIGRQLLSTVLQYRSTAGITVNASLTSVPAYGKFGFRCNGEVDEKDGLVFQPMLLSQAI